jgi:indole-3-glycerol phosphate synthase
MYSQGCGGSSPLFGTNSLSNPIAPNRFFERGFAASEADAQGIYTEDCMSTHLDRILATTRATVAASKSRTSIPELEKFAVQHQPRGWARALQTRAASAPAIIAELKKASPSKGLIRADFDIEWLAQRYAAGGATALSVLTDEPYFQGSLRNLELASTAVSLPCLRKDFTVDEYQILEARAHSADAILLIVAALTDAELLQFTRAAHALTLDVLIEVHTREELDRVLSLSEMPDAIGVNNRDLRTFEVRLETSLDLVERIPAGVVRVAESGIRTSADVARLRGAGFDAFLIGESLMLQPNPALALQDLLEGVAAAKIAAGLPL